MVRFSISKKKKNSTALNKWWEAGKICFKILAIQFPTIKNQKMNKTLRKLTQNILQEKIQTHPDENKIQNWQNSIDDIENYNTMGSVIRNKEKLIVNEEIPNKFFYQIQKENQTKNKLKHFKTNKTKHSNLIMTFLKNATDITKIYTKNKTIAIECNKSFWKTYLK